MSRSTTVLRWRIAPITALAALLVLLTGSVTPAVAQLSAGGAIPSGLVGRGVDAAYDPARNSYLVVNASFGPIRGVHVDGAGTPIGAPFGISSGVGFSNFTRARYSPHVNGGAGGFLVVWSSEENGVINVRARVVASGGGAIGAEYVIGTGGWLESAPAIGYSPTSQRFLVAWGGFSIPRIQAVLVNINGTPASQTVQLSTTYARDPGVTWNPDRNEFGVSFNGETSNGVYSAFAVVPLTNPALFRRTSFNEVVGGRSYITDVDYDTASRTYTMVWCDGLNIQAARFSTDGNLAGTNLVALSACTADSLAVAYNPHSQTFLAGGLHPTSDAFKGVELSGSSPVNVETGAFLARYPRVTANSEAIGWLVTTTAPGWVVSAARITTGGATTPPPPGPTPPPPAPPPPPPPSPAFPNGCAGLTPPAWDWICDVQNGAWLPPDNAAGGGLHGWRAVWQNSSQGILATWNMTGAKLGFGGTLAPSVVSDTQWQIVGGGDFNNDGRRDILWQHRTTRVLVVWLMNGNTFIGAGNLSHNTVDDKGWAARFVADMNADGRPDIVWQHETQGWIVVWLMNGLTLNQALLFNPGRVTDLNWRLVGAGNFNGDSYNDLVWQNRTTGTTAIWLMNGAAFAASGVLSHHTVRDRAWQIEAVVDADGNGTHDFVWRHQVTGKMALSFLNGLTVAYERVINPDVVQTVWRLVDAR
jgi:hypothetical protein